MLMTKEVRNGILVSIMTFTLVVQRALEVNRGKMFPKSERFVAFTFNVILNYFT